MSEDCISFFELMHNLAACRDWYERDGTCARKVKYVTSIIWLLYSWLAVTVYISLFCLNCLLLVNAVFCC